MENLLLKQAQKYCGHFNNLLGISCVPVDCKKNVRNAEIDIENPICRACEKYKNFQCYGIYAFRQGCEGAYRWEGMYVCLCKLGLVLVNSFISDEQGEFVGGIVAGPICMGEAEDNLQGIYDDQLEQAISEAKCYSPGQIQSLAETIAAIAAYISGVSHGKAGKYFYRQETLLNAIYAEKVKSVTDNDYYIYPIALERKLRMSVRNKDKEGAQVILNQILAYIYVSNDSDLEAIKPRITELVVVMSRAAVDAGADMNEIFLLTQGFIKNIEEFRTIESLSAWISDMLQTFISYTFDFVNVKHADVVYKSIEYIKNNYMKRITLDEIAANTYISKTYLSSIFKKETGDSISNYINQVRVDRSKLLLMEDNLDIVEIANICGFESQSYFTKVFRSIAGITPKRYRQDRGKR